MPSGYFQVHEAAFGSKQERSVVTGHPGGSDSGLGSGEKLAAA